MIVQWLGLHFNLPRARGWIPGWGTETPLAAQPKKQQQQGMYIGRIWIKSRRMEGIWLGDEDILVPEIKMIQNKQTKNNPRRRAGGSKGKRSECDVEGAHRAPPIVPLCLCWNAEPSSAGQEGESEPERKILFLLNVEIQGVFVGMCVSASEHFYIL